MSAQPRPTTASRLSAARYGRVSDAVSRETSRQR
jgi:hypothetical protein